MEDDGDDKDDIKRKTRNLSEKKRRDQFNSLVTELSNLISNNNRKIDKSTVLRSTISFLKNHNEVTVRSRAHDVQEDWKPAFLSNEEFTYLVLEALEGFIMVFSASGRIHYASESVISLLGHNPDELVNQNIFNLMHEDDQQNLYNLLQGSTAAEQIENQSKENEMIRFQIHIRRGCLDFREEVSYDLVQFYGHFRTNQEQDNERDSMDFREVDPSSRILFVCIGCLHTPKLIRDVSLVDSTRNEFTSRHSLEWKFLFLDHRAPPIIGYLPFEVLGTSGYDYYHFDDLEKVVTCHEALMRKGELTSCFYRFLTKGQQWIWLQTRFYITYHQWNSKPEFVVCTHRVVSYAEVIKTKEEVIEQDTDMNEADNAASMNEMSVKDPPMSPPYNISEENADAYANAYQTISQARYIYNQKRATAAKKNLSHKISVANPQSKTFNDIKNQAIKSSRHSLVQVQAPEPQLSRPERPKSSLSALLECFPGPCDPPMQPASVKSASTCSTGGTITQTAVTTAGTWDCEQLGHAGRSDTPVSGESHTSQRNSKGELAKCMYYPKRSSVTKKDLFRKALVASLRSKAVRNIKNNIKQYSPSDIMNPCCVLERNNNTIKIPRALAGKVQDPEPQLSRPVRPKSSLSAFLEKFPGPSDPPLQPASVKSASASSTGGTIAQAAVTTADTWDCTQARYTGGSDTSVSGESHISQRNSELELRVPQPQPPPQPQAHQPSKQDCIIAPQHVMGTQYLDPTSYVAGPISPGLLTATPLGPQDQAQIQEQLHRKHEELQQMIVRQQEELRQVKEQLLLARLGILQPLINVPANTYTTQAELQNQERMSQLTYTMAGPRPPLPYYTAQGPLQLALPSMSAQPPQQPHPDDQHMPQ